MCNDYRLKVDVGAIAADFADLKIKIRFDEGRPNIQAEIDAIGPGRQRAV